jgi:hypothetical protein
MTEALKMLFSRDLAKLKTEIELYKQALAYRSRYCQFSR